MGMGHLLGPLELPCETGSVVTIATRPMRDRAWAQAQGGWVACPGMTTNILTLICVVPKALTLYVWDVWGGLSVSGGAGWSASSSSERCDFG